MQIRSLADVREKQYDCLLMGRSLIKVYTNYEIYNNIVNDIEKCILLPTPHEYSTQCEVFGVKIIPSTKVKNHRCITRRKGWRPC
tara:strand:- start:18626 stop:18880 length:255 start_codon:yes stop_codon:yes gene_type:complete